MVPIKKNYSVRLSDTWKVLCKTSWLLSSIEVCWKTKAEKWLSYQEKNAHESLAITNNNVVKNILDKYFARLWFLAIYIIDGYPTVSNSKPQISHLKCVSQWAPTRENIKKLTQAKCEQYWTLKKTGCWHHHIQIQIEKLICHNWPIQSHFHNKIVEITG